MTENNTHSKKVFAGHTHATFSSSAVRNLNRWTDHIKKKSCKCCRLKLSRVFRTKLYKRSTLIAQNTPSSTIKLVMYESCYLGVRNRSLPEQLPFIA